MPPADEIVTGVDDVGGYHLFLASAANSWRWRALATIDPAGYQGDLWLGAHCITGDGRYVVAVILARHETNESAGLDRGAAAYAIDATDGSVRPLLGGVALRYFTPGCGMGDRVAFARYLGEDGMTTDVLLADASTGRLVSQVTVPRELIDPIPVGNGVEAILGSQVVSVGMTTGQTEVKASFDGRPFRLRAASDGSVGVLVAETFQAASAWRLDSGVLHRLGGGRLGDLNLAATRRGKLALVNPTDYAGGSSVRALHLAHPFADLSLDGAAVLVNTPASARTPSRAGSRKDPGGGTISEATTLLAAASGLPLATTVPSAGGAPVSEAVPSAVASTNTANSPSTSGPALATASPMTSTSTPRCAVPRDDPTIQVPQPGTPTIDWGIQEGVRNLLTGANARPAGVWNLGLPAYSPNVDFPAPTLQGAPAGTPVPPQVLEGILAQESNWDQASFHAPRGGAGNPLVANYYGSSDATFSDINYANADCGYGIAQVTDFMTAADTTQPQSIKNKVAVDYAENIAAGLSILGSKWNQLYSMGITVNNADPTRLENWYDALWAYNSGINANDGAGHFGLGWSNNPINPKYDPSRAEFNTNPGDTATPYKWPYQELVMGWMDNPLADPNSGQPDYQSATPTGDHLTIPPMSTFCTLTANSCNPNDPTKMYCTLSNDHCWWHTTATFADCTQQGLGFCHGGFFTVAASQNEPPTVDPNPPVCSSALQSNAIIVDEEATDLNVVGCPNPPSNWTNGGSFTTSFGTDSSGQPVGVIDWHQLGAGFGGHMWFTHTRATSEATKFVTGTWQPSSLPFNGGTYQIAVFIPDLGGTDPTATYQVTPGSGQSSTPVTINQDIYSNQWVSLGSFSLYSGAALTLSNVQGSAADGTDIAFGAAAFIPVSGAPAPAGAPITAPEGYGDGTPTEVLFCFCQGHAGDPVDTATGNFHETSHDMSIPGRGVALDLSRTYNSLTPSAAGPLGFGWSFVYGMTLQQNVPSTGQVTITEEEGSQIVFTPSGSAYTAPPRVSATLVHNADGTFNFTRHARSIFVFNAAGKLITLRDLNGYNTSLVYNASGQLSTVTDPAGRALTFTWLGAHIASVSDVAGRTVQYGYNDGAGNLTDVTDVNGGHQGYSYDANHRMATFTDERGNTTHMWYDSQGRVTKQTDGLNQPTTFAYTGDNLSAAGGTTTITDAKNNATLEQYANGERLTQTKGYGTSQAVTVTFSYDPNTLGITRLVDGNGQVTLMSYDSQGNETAKTDPMGRQTSAIYDALNDQLTSKDGNQITTTKTYDSAGNLKTVSRPLIQNGTTVATQLVTYHHDDPAHPGDLTSMTDADGKTWSYAYDAAGDQTKTADPLGDATTTTYNAIGWKLTVVSARGNVAGCSCAATYTTTYGYTDTAGHTDEFGDPLAVTDPLGHVTHSTYDGDRNLLSQRDGDGNLTTFGYDADNRRTDVHRPDGTDVVTQYWPDGTTSAEFIMAADGTHLNETDYGYDALARLTAVTLPATTANSNRTPITYTYDGNGNRLTKTDQMGRTTTWTYDKDNEMASIAYSDGVTPNVTQVQYDADGQRTKLSDGSGTSSWGYDSLNRITSFTDGGGNSLAYSYDLKGQATTITYPGSHQLQRHFDDAGHLDHVTDWNNNTVVFAPDPEGHVVNQQDANGVSQATGYDAAGRVATISDAPTGTPSSPFATLSYVRDSNGQVKSETSTGISGGGGSFGYDGLNQVTSTAGGSYGYNNTNDLTTMPSGVSQSFDAADEAVSSQLPITVVGTPTSGSNPGTATSINLPLPSGIQANDQIIITVTQKGTVAPTASGYTAIASATLSAALSPAMTTAFRRTAAGGEQTATVSFKAPASAAAIAVVYRGVDPGNPVDGDVTATAQQATGVTTGSLNASGNLERLVIAEGATGNPSGASWTAPAGMTEESQRTDVANVAAGIADQLLPSAGATGTRTANLSGSANLADVAFTLAPVRASMAYDAAGDRLSGGEVGTASAFRQYTYDQTGRLTAVPGVATYSYNGDGLRVSKSVPGQTLSYVWDQSSSQHELLSDGNLAWVYGPDGMPVEQISLHPGIRVGGIGTAGDANGTAATLTVNLSSQAPPNSEILLATTEAGSGAVTPPPGFSLIAQVPSGTGATATQTLLFGKVASGGETGFTLSYAGTAAKTALAAVYLGVDTMSPGGPLDGVASNPAPLATSVTVPAITTTNASDALVMVAGADRNTAAASWTIAGMTDVVHKTNQVLSGIDMAEQTLGAAGSTGARTASYSATAPAYLGGILVALRATATTMYFHRDQLGSTRAITDDSGAVRFTTSYDAYGNLLQPSGRPPTPLLYAGQYQDVESGLYYLRARYYDPATAQFMSPDPLASETREPYSYAGNDPLNAIDPLGLDWWNPFSWSSDTWTTIGKVASGVGIVAGGALLCAATACVGDIAVAAGATTLAETLGAAETTSTIASWVGLGSGVVGGIADGVRAYESCHTGFSAECALDAGAVALDLATFGVDGRIAEDTIAKPIYALGSGAAVFLYGEIGDLMSRC